MHVPFCAGACDYCDFYSVPVMPNDNRMAVYVDKILSDCDLLFREHKITHIPSVYIGGGTPSVLGAGLTAKLLNGLSAYWKGSHPVALSMDNAPAEITVEANPESCDMNFLHAARDAGVTRISMGIQTFNEDSRLAVHRVGDGKLLDQRLNAAAAVFPNNFSVDLLSGLPYQSESVLKNDIERVIAYKPSHVSLYALTAEPETPLALNMAKGLITLPSNDEADRLWLYGRDYLEDSGYTQYEVSNFCVPEKESCHNMRYWRMENWLGLGPGASGTIIDDESAKGQRFTNTADIDLWLNSETTPVTKENLDKLTLIKETFLMGFRTVNGPDEQLFQRRFKKSIQETIPQTIKAWLAKGLFQTNKTALTKQGLLMLNSFLIEVWQELEYNQGYGE